MIFSQHISHHMREEIHYEANMDQTDLTRLIEIPGAYERAISIPEDSPGHHQAPMQTIDCYLEGLWAIPSSKLLRVAFQQPIIEPVEQILLLNRPITLSVEQHKPRPWSAQLAQPLDLSLWRHFSTGQPGVTEGFPNILAWVMAILLPFGH